MNDERNYDFGDLNARRPPNGFTDAEWQEYFLAMYRCTKQSRDWNMNRRRLIANNNWKAIEDQSTYCGDTQWEKYCDFINDVLASIRSGRPDYCYYIYQIAELLGFEHERLKTEYLPDEGCFRVWLDGLS